MLPGKIKTNISYLCVLYVSLSQKARAFFMEVVFPHKKENVSF